MAISTTKPGIDLGIVTTKGPAMLAFYQGTLGLHKEGEMPMPGGKGLMHRLRCGDSLVKLVEMPGELAPAAPGGIAKAAGYRYWTISVPDLAPLVAACEAAGHPVVMKPTEIRPGVRIAMVADPDGNWVEFLQLG